MWQLHMLAINIIVCTNETTQFIFISLRTYQVQKLQSFVHTMKTKNIYFISLLSGTKTCTCYCQCASNVKKYLPFRHVCQSSKFPQSLHKTEPKQNQAVSDERFLRRHYKKTLNNESTHRSIRIHTPLPIGILGCEISRIWWRNWAVQQQHKTYRKWKQRPGHLQQQHQCWILLDHARPSEQLKLQLLLSELWG